MRYSYSFLFIDNFVRYHAVLFIIDNDRVRSLNFRSFNGGVLGVVFIMPLSMQTKLIFLSSAG